MAYFSSLQNFIDTITTRFNKPHRSLNNEGLLKQDIVEALSDVGKYAYDMKVASETVNANFVSRSLKLTAVVYINGTTGNDSNTGSNSVNAIKTMARLIELYSEKCVNLSIYVTGTVEIDSNMTLSVPSVWFLFYPDGKLYIRKLPSNDGNFNLTFASSTVQFATNGGGLGELKIEGHAGNINGDSAITYALKQGGIRLLKTHFDDYRSGFSIQSISVNVMQLTVGDNATLFCGYEDGTYPNEFMKTSFLFLGTIYGPTLGSGSTMEAGFYGNRIFPRVYTPTSSTDVNVLDKELVSDANYLYRKSGSTIKKIAWSSF